jgi:hypothetical protein
VQRPSGPQELGVVEHARTTRLFATFLMCDVLFQPNNSLTIFPLEPTRLSIAGAVKMNS